MEITGITEFRPAQISTATYTYISEFAKDLDSCKLQELLTLQGRNIVETEEFSFNTGILKTTKHSFKAYFLMNKCQIFLKVKMGTPALYADFTHSKIEVQGVARNSTVKRNTSDEVAFGGGSSFRTTYTTQPHFTLYGVRPTSPTVVFLPPKPPSAESRFIRATREQLTATFASTEYNMDDVTEMWWVDSHYVHGNNKISSPIEITVKTVYWKDEKVIVKTKENLVPPSVFPHLTSLDTISLYNDKDLSDFIILCGGTKFQVHKVVLANRSPVFATMFQVPMSESISGVVEIADTEPKAMEQFVRFLYTGEADIENFAAELFSLGDKYSVDDLKNSCETYLQFSVTNDTVFDMYQVAARIKSELLSAKCVSVLKRNVQEILKDAEGFKAFAQDYPDLFYQVLVEKEKASLK